MADPQQGVAAEAAAPAGGDPGITYDGFISYTSGSDGRVARRTRGSRAVSPSVPSAQAEAQSSDDLPGCAVPASTSIESVRGEPNRHVDLVFGLAVELISSR